MMEAQREKKILLTWIGSTDLSILPPRGDGVAHAPNAGPIDTLLGNDRFEVMYCCFNEEFADRVPGFFACMEARHRGVLSHGMDAGDMDPTDYQHIFDFMQVKLAAIRKKEHGKRIVLNLSSGTSAISSVMLYIGKTLLPDAELLATRPPNRANGKDLVVPVRWAFGSSMREQEDAPTDAVHGVSPHKLRTLKLLSADKDVSLLLLGESGSGKSHLAQKIHAWSKRTGEFRKVNCAAFSDDPNMAHTYIFGCEKGAYTGADSRKSGELELAHKGTLFLDEVGDLPPRIQGLLLLALDSGEFTPLGGKDKIIHHAGIIYATNKDLVAEVNAGRFREDLYYRIANYSVELVPVRCLPKKERQALLLSLLAKQCERHKQIWEFSPAALERLVDHPWPGNIRQMQTTLKLLCLLTDGAIIQESLVKEELDSARAPTPALQPLDANLPLRIPPSFKIDRELKSIRGRYVKAALEQTKTKTEAAKLLGITLQRIRDYIREMEV